MALNGIDVAVVNASSGLVDPSTTPQGCTQLGSHHQRESLWTRGVDQSRQLAWHLMTINPVEVVYSSP